MIKLLYDFPSDIINDKEIFSADFISLGIVSEKKIITKFIEKLLSCIKSPDIIISKVKCDDITLQRCNKKLLSKDKFIYPLKSVGFLYFKSAELHVRISNKKDIDVIMNDWGHYDKLIFFVCSSQYASLFINHLKSILYSDSEDIEEGALSNFKLIIGQSGDENEAEIVCPKKYFEFIQSQFNELLKTILFGSKNNLA